MTYRPEYEGARERGNAARVSGQTRLYPEHLPKILRLRRSGESFDDIGKRWGVRGPAVRAFLKRQGAG